MLLDWAQLAIDNLAQIAISHVNHVTVQTLEVVDRLRMRVLRRSSEAVEVVASPSTVLLKARWRTLTGRGHVRHNATSSSDSDTRRRAMLLEQSFGFVALERRRGRVFVVATRLDCVRALTLALHELILVILR